MKSKQVLRIRDILGKDLLSVVEYNRCGESVIVLVVKSVCYEDIGRFNRLFRRSAFILLTEDDLTVGKEVLCIPFVHIRNHSRVVEGKDFFRKLSIPKKKLLVHLQYEVRNKLIYLREEYVLARNKRFFLQPILPQFSILLEALLYYKDEEVTEDFRRDIQTVEKGYGVSLEIFRMLYARYSENEKIDAEEVSDVFQRVEDQLTALLTNLCAMG